MRWSWISFGSGVAGGCALAGFLWLTFAEAPQTSPREPTAAAPAPTGGAEETPPAEPTIVRAAGRSRVARAPQQPREDAPPPVDQSGGGGVSYVADGVRLSGAAIQVRFEGGQNGVFRIVSALSRGDPAPAFLEWSIDRAREVFPDDGPIARSEAASRLAAAGYADRATGLGLATRVQPPPVELLVDAARDTSYPDLRGAALLAAARAAPGDDRVRAAILDLALDGDSGVRQTATGLLEKLGDEGARRAAEILLAGDYTSEVLPRLTAPVAAHGDVGAFLGASPPPDAALSVVQQLADRLKEPKDEADRRLSETLPQLIRPLLEAPEADRYASMVLPQLAALGHGAFLRSVASTPLYRPRVRSAAVTAALGEDATRPDGIAAAGAILTDPTADVALARGILGAVQDEWLDDPTLRGALESAARGHPSAWVRDDARKRLAAHDPGARGTIVVHEAKYGVGADWIDVADAVRGAIQEGRLKVQSGNELGGDPKPGAHKQLRVEYTLGGERRLATVGEGGWLTIP